MPQSPSVSRNRRLIRLLLASLLFLAPHVLGQSKSPSPSLPHLATNGYVGNEACARCHSAIYGSYKNTAMARASGPAEQNLISGDFTHQKSGVHYRIYKESGRVWLSFDRGGVSPVSGKRELLFNIGFLVREIAGN